MMNIMIVGVGGQGLVLTSSIVCEVALRSGYDVKSNDVIGLSQRGGRVWANIRYAKKVYSPNIPVGASDYLLALEPLEGLRYKSMLKTGGVLFMNQKIIYPSDVVYEKVEYPTKDIENMLKEFESYALDASAKGKEIGNMMVANTIILGMLAKKLDFDLKIWEDVITQRVPKKAQTLNKEAFDFGYDYVN